MRWSFILFFSLILIQSVKAFTGHTQLHFGLGMVQGSFSGPVEGEFSVPSSLNLEFEFFSSSRASYTIRNVMAMDSQTSRMAYSGTSFGGRYYINSQGIIIEQVDKGNYFKSVPRWRYYAGWDLGMSQVLVKSFGPVLTVSSSLFEFGGHAGVIYQLGQTFGLELQGSYSYGYGFSSVAVTGQIQKIFIDGTYYY